jgi:hypothetical protein
LKEWFTTAKVVLTPISLYSFVAHVAEESVALFQAATDEHWGADCSKLIEAISVHDFNRHFLIARSTTYRMDLVIMFAIEWSALEKTGNVQHCIEINEKKYRAMESYMRAAPPPGAELGAVSTGLGSFVGVEAHHQHLRPRRNITGVFKCAGINSIQEVEGGYLSSAEFEFYQYMARSSADGLTHMFHEHAWVAMMRAVLSFAADTRDVELSWLDELPPVETTTLFDTCWSAVLPTTARVLVAEVFEQQGRHADAIQFAQTDLQDYHNRNVPSKVRAGRVLGRCHAALGQHMLSVSAFDAAIGLARSGKLLLSEALSVRGRAAAGRNRAEGGQLHWDEETGKQRLAEVMGRMQGPKEALERVLVLP